MDQLRIGKVGQKLKLVSFLCLVGIVDAEILDVLLLELWREAVHDVGSVAGVAHMAVGVDVTEMDGSFVHHGHVFPGGDFSAGQTAEFGGEGGSLPHGKVGGTHDSAVFEIDQYPGAAAGNEVIVIHVKNLVAAGQLESSGGLLPGLYPEGLVCLGMIVNPQAHTGNKDGNAAVLQHSVAHAPLVIVLHSRIRGGQQ